MERVNSASKSTITLLALGSPGNSKKIEIYDGSFLMKKFLTMTYLEHRINQLLAEAQRLSFKLYHYIKEEEDFEVDPNGAEIPDWLTCGEYEIVQPFECIALSLHESIVCYLDQNQLHDFQHLYFDTFGKMLDVNSVRSFKIDHSLAAPYNVWLKNITRFLAVFEFASSDNERYLHLAGIKYLETILKNTAAIVLNSEKQISKETDVTSVMRPIISAIFPSVITATSNFLKTAKEYKPDILIPELHVAVEYKYAADETKLKACIDSIYTDFQGYKGDEQYRIFYAVFYLTADFWGQEKYFATWKETGFPRNWRAFFVIGR